LAITDIGNARIAGLETDLDLSSDQYEWVITAFYIAYIVFEWMSLLWKIVPAHIYVSCIVMSWGITASLQSCATSFPVLIVLRFLLGIGEAGFTGIPYFLSFFFKRNELALRTGFFISAAPLATSFASSLAWLILKVGEHGPIAPWRLLFLVEGFPSVLVAVMAWHVIPDGPGKARFLTKREKKVARLRLRREKGPKSDSSKNEGLKWREVVQTLMDPKSYLTAVMFFCTNMAFSSMPVFLPTIIRDMGHSALASQALSAPPYLVSFLVVILSAWLSDRFQNRSFFICFYALVSACGYAFAAVAGYFHLGIWWRYAAIYPAAIGFFSVITIIITWTINNQESESKQGAGFAILQVIGQCGPLVGTRLYPDTDAPLYVKGMSICAGAMVLVAVLAIVLRIYLTRENSKKELAYGLVGDEAQETLVSKEDQGISAARFEYML
jgi:MFS family permease